jgi:hypothetical protein
MMLKLVGTWLKLLLLMATVVTVAAIGLGRANPGSPPRRVASPPSYQVLDHAITNFHGGGVYVVNLDTGQLETLRLPPGMTVDRGSLSPWEEDGRRQIVGVGRTRSGNGGSLPGADLKLVRISFPDGEILDGLTLDDDALPVGAPCWIPGASAGVLYVGGDLRLYRVEFEPSRLDGGANDEADPRPRTLGWQAPLPGAGDVQFRDLSWPEGPRLGGRALASLRFKDRETGRYTDWQVWWLQLSRSGASIVAAGRLLETDLADVEVTRRLPNLLNVGGGPALTYLQHRPDQSGYQLRVAPVHFDPDSGSPIAHQADSRTLAENCPPISPAASPDGRWITVVRATGPHLNAERIAIPVAAALERASSDLLVSRGVLRPVSLGRADRDGLIGDPAQHGPGGG